MLGLHLSHIIWCACNHLKGKPCLAFQKERKKPNSDSQHDLQETHLFFLQCSSLRTQACLPFYSVSLLHTHVKTTFNIKVTNLIFVLFLMRVWEGYSFPGTHVEGRGQCHRVGSPLPPLQGARQGTQVRRQGKLLYLLSLLAGPCLCMWFCNAED